MKLTDAQAIIKEVDGKAFSWLKAWGLATIGEAIRTIKARKSATQSDVLAAERVSTRIFSKA